MTTITTAVVDITAVDHTTDQKALMARTNMAQTVAIPSRQEKVFSNGNLAKEDGVVRAEEQVTHPQEADRVAADQEVEDLENKHLSRITH